MDPKEREQANWTQVAPGWKKHDARLRAALHAASERLIERAGVAQGHRVLDIACGTGEPALPAAERVGPQGRVLAIDFVEEMLVFAREKAAARGLSNVEFRCVDGERLDLDRAAFDAALCRWGLMFMPDAVSCLRHVHAALRPGSRLAAACWGPPDRNPWATIPMGTMKELVEVPTPPPDAPGIFAFADPARLRGAFEAAGFRDVAVEDVAMAMGGEFSTGEDYVSYVLDLAGPLARLYSGLSGDRQAEFRRRAAAKAEALRSGGAIRIPGVTWVASGTRP